ncbi:MAG: RES family NAD+ phosphorylase [Dehalococcoidia bacterium]
MINAWRLTAAHWAATAFTGDGARRAGGRWNSKGRSVVYTSQSQALALLEQVVHFEPDTAPRPFVIIAVGLPDDLVESVSLSSLPRFWRETGSDALAATRSLGDQWLMDRRSAALSVPSAIVPAERNFLLNPEHVDFPSLLLDQAASFDLDPRLLFRSVR